MTKVLKVILRIYFGVWIEDANVPFRLIKKGVLKQHIKSIPQNFNLSNVMLSVSLVHYDSKIKFIPITFRPRQGGVNSINFKRIIGIGRQAVKDFAVIKKGMR